MAQTTIPATPRQRTTARQALGLGTVTSIPVYVIPGHLSPRKVGTSGGHFTRGGRRISHPSAYSRRGWSNMVYHCSTRRIYVGDRWLAEYAA